jgi:FkbM family methyltransferase
MFVTHPIGRKRPVATLLRLWIWQVWRRTVKTAVVADVQGCHILCPPWSNLASAWISVGLHEYAEMRFALDFVRPGDIVVDVGANLGVYSVLLARRGARVWAFEPDPQARQILLTNLRLNNVGENVVIEDVALSDSDGEAYFTVDHESSNHIVHRRSASENSTLIQVRKLDDYLGRMVAGRGSEAVTFVKIDTEGFDGNVLMGAESLLQRARPVLCVETWGGGRTIRDWLRTRGYLAFLYDAKMRRLWRVPEEYRKQANFLVVHQEVLSWVAERIGQGPLSA